MLTRWQKMSIYKLRHQTRGRLSSFASVFGRVSVPDLAGGAYEVTTLPRVQTLVGLGGDTPPHI